VESRGIAVFEKGRAYTREQIHLALGGSRREALPSKGGKVLCACLTPERNPRAPEEIVIGGQERAVRRARALTASGDAVPVFVRLRRGEWAFAGARRVRAVIEDPGALLAIIAEGAPSDASLALLLEEAPAGSGTAAGAPPGSPAAPGA
jgi:hypothetical protein